MKEHMVNEESWNYFRNTGLLFLVNTLLHTFGWSIVLEIDNVGGVKRVYPARVKFRGFSEQVTKESYKKIATYIHHNSEVLLEETFNE